jgi:hypothetical protein
MPDSEATTVSPSMTSRMIAVEPSSGCEMLAQAEQMTARAARPDLRGAR